MYGPYSVVGPRPLRVEFNQVNKENAVEKVQHSTQVAALLLIPWNIISPDLACPPDWHVAELSKSRGERKMKAVK